MNYRITENWLADVFGTLFSFFDKQEVRALDVPGMEESDDPASVAAGFYSNRAYKVISQNMNYIPTDTRIDMETFQKEASEECISRVKGYVLFYQPIKCSAGFGVTEISELWLLEDGRFAEVISVCFFKDKQFHIHRKFRKIVKRKKDICFKVADLEDALFLICLSGIAFPEIGCCK